jgi:hypothetical protein
MAKYVVYIAGINQKLNKSDGKEARGHVASACLSPICNRQQQSPIEEPGLVNRRYL